MEFPSGTCLAEKFPNWMEVYRWENHWTIAGKKNQPCDWWPEGPHENDHDMTIAYGSIVYEYIYIYDCHDMTIAYDVLIHPFS